MPVTRNTMRRAKASPYFWKVKAKAIKEGHYTVDGVVVWKAIPPHVWPKVSVDSAP